MMRNVLTLFCTIHVLSLVGCGGTPPASLTGNVTYSGATIERGSLRLFPTTKETGRGASAAIKNGKYEIAIDKGVLAGPYKVAIIADKLSGPNAAAVPKVSGPGTSQAMEQTEYIPLEYNVDTKLEITVEPGENQKDFVLPTK